MSKTSSSAIKLAKGPALRLNVVLVRSIYESNVGATSRAMSNMGAQRLILLDPQCEIGETAQKAAATGQAALQQRTIYKNWQSFHESESGGVRIAFTARGGRARDVRDYAETLQWLETEHELFVNSGAAPIPVYLIFGPEDWGLSTEDLALAHFACSIPTFGKNWSLNLAQAVLLALYTLRLKWPGEAQTSRAQLEAGSETHSDSRIQNAAPVVFPEQTLKTWLIEMGFQVDHSKVNVFSILRRMLLHNVPSAKEVSVLEVVLQQSIRKLREYNEMRQRRD